MNHSSKSFFDRLGSPDQPKSRAARRDRITDTAGSIKRQLELVLNARKGSSLCASEFGLDDFNDHTIGSVDMISLIRQDIEQAIYFHEPRIKVNSVQHEPDGDRPLELKFVIDGYIEAGDHSESIALAISMDYFTHHCTL